jgi:hypothetical protein
MRWEAIKAFTALQQAGKPFEIFMCVETSRGKGWAVHITPDPNNPDLFDYYQSRYVTGRVKPRPRKYWRVTRRKMVGAKA